MTGRNKESSFKSDSCQFLNTATRQTSLEIIGLWHTDSFDHRFPDIGHWHVLLVTSLPLAVAFAVAATKLDDQSYFAASASTKAS